MEALASTALHSPSSLVLKATGLAPITDRKLDHDSICGLCGHPLVTGTLVVELDLGRGFNNVPSMANRAGKYSCGACQALRGPKFLMDYACAVVTPSAYFPFRKNVDQAYFLLNPPSEPFLMFNAAIKQQHLIWRTPVNYSQKLFVVRFGDKLLRIRHSYLLALLDASEKASTWLNQQQEADTKTKGKRKSAYNIRHPFRLLERKMEETEHAQFHHELIQRWPAFSNELPDVMDTLCHASQGELWALTILLQTAVKTPLNQLAQPKPIFANGEITV